jgi:hypothetical protein
MAEYGWIIVAAGIGAMAAVAIFGRPLWQNRRRQHLIQARKNFHFQRERLECHFFQIASHSGKPRGLRWTDCDFDDGVTYARDRQTGELSALVAVTIRFEAVEGGPMEHNPNVSRQRAATAVFRFNGRSWETAGRAIFNLNPSEAIEHFRESLVMVGHEAAART